MLFGQLKTFSKGGVHPEGKKVTQNKSIQTLPPSEKISLVLKQHLGAPAIPVVGINERVKVGQLVAMHNGHVSANLHSSVSGRVDKIEDVLDISGYNAKAITISVEGDDWDETIDRSPDVKYEFNLNTVEILKRIQDAGIVGLGGAAFPSHVKLAIPYSKYAKILILNGVECEPCLTADHRLMMEKGEEILIGARILMRAVHAHKTLIGIENNKTDAIRNLETLAKKYEDIKVYALKVKYPQGCEKQLVKVLMDREIPNKGLPIDVHTIVDNVGTAYAVYEAVQKNKPLIERVVTVTGKYVKDPCNFFARIGTPVEHLIQAAGGLPENTGKIVMGGPMMGKSLSSLDYYVTKATNGLLVIPIEDSKRKKIRDCIRCAKCVSVCPAGLEPYKLMTLVERSQYNDAAKEKIDYCMECGSCSYICPSYRPLLDYIRLGKSVIKKQIA